ncbi:unnamed protein product [Rotaria sp. Silwood2]|nr:unnamed protein product [Rotaria sp. Silwood2]CAF4419832.1 unnamed protein product [Rotaria sp. Silwood2]CAF4458560.1 unnamed protein product [Rotaria sp. Silwood2]
MGNHPGSIIHKLTHRKSSTHIPSTPLSPTEFVLPSKTTYFETFILVWLDPNVDTNTENVKTQECLREILTCLITFDTVEACQNWLKKCCSDEKIILIVSGAYGQQIVPQIHHLSAIVAIYIYCLDIERNKDWTQNFAKIRNIISSTDILLQELSLDQVNLESVEDSKALKIYKHEQQVCSLDTATASFLCYQLLLEILISPNYITTPGTFYELIHILHQYSSDDKYGTKLINEFKKTYTPNKAVSWLTRDTPLLRFVNKALREQDFDMLFALRFLLVDIHSQLTTHQARSLNVFKLQLMLKDEMENIRANPGQLLVVNGFLFASTNMSQLISSITNNDQYETILFDIKADFRPGVVPFALLHDIDSTIKHKINREVLFMCGSIFEVGPLTHEDSIWKLKLKLASENDSSILFNMKQKLKETKNYSILGDLLYQYNQEEKASIYYERLSSELPNNQAFVSQINKQSTGKHTRSNSNKDSIPNVPFALINLSEHISEFASAVLYILCSVTSNLIYVMNDASTNDCYQWPKRPMSIFTTAQFVSSSEKKIPKYIKFFVLSDSKNNTEQQQQFTTIDELICRLVDEIIQHYRFEANEFIKMKNSIKMQEQYKQINRIYHELKNLDVKFAKNNSSSKKSENIEPILIWLLSNTGYDEEDTKSIAENFKDNFSSYLTFYDPSEFHSYLLIEENITDMFIIIYRNYEESIVECVRQFPNVKYVYYYEASKNKMDNMTTNRDDLRYRITSDLIDYYAKLGEKYQTNKKSKEARQIFLKAQKLCRLLSENYF